MSVIAELNTAEGGVYGVSTASGTHYWIDLDEMKLIRFKEAEQGMGFPSNDLRKDAEWIQLLDVQDKMIRVGERAVFLLSGLAEDVDVVTVRETTPVVQIWKWQDD